MTMLSDEYRRELEAGVSQARLAEIAGVSVSTLRHYEGLGLVPFESRDGRRAYGAAAVAALEDVKRLKADGLKLAEIAERRRVSTPDRAVLESELARLRAQLAAEQARLKLVQARLEARRDAATTALAEADEVLALREANQRRAAQVLRRAVAARYAMARPRIVRIDPSGKGSKKK